MINPANEKCLKLLNHQISWNQIFRQTSTRRNSLCKTPKESTVASHFPTNFKNYTPSFPLQCIGIKQNISSSKQVYPNLIKTQRAYKEHVLKVPNAPITTQDESKYQFSQEAVGVKVQSRSKQRPQTAKEYDKRIFNHDEINSFIQNNCKGARRRKRSKLPIQMIGARRND